MERPHFPAAIDNTIRSSFKACQRKTLYRFILNWNSPYPSIHLHAGIAFAKGMEVTRKEFYQKGTDADLAVALGWEALHAEYGDFDASATPNKSASRMGDALVSYFNEYPLEHDSIKPAMFNGAPAVEFNFAIPLPIMNPETGDPIIYCGRFDMLGDTGGQLYVVDEKTTGSLGTFWAKRYELSAQFTGYCWAAQQYGLPVVGAIIRGIGILSGEIKHAAMPLMRPQFLIDEWYTQLLRDVDGLVRAWTDTDWESVADDQTVLVPPREPNIWTEWEPDYNDACGSFGGCDYMSVCGIAPYSRLTMLKINFVQRVWEPLKGNPEGE